MRTGVTKQQLVASLADTLRLTREDVEDLVLVDEDTVQIIYDGGGTRTVNIHCDSGIAIIRDVCRQID